MPKCTPYCKFFLINTLQVYGSGQEYPTQASTQDVPGQSSPDFFSGYDYLFTTATPQQPEDDDDGDDDDDDGDDVPTPTPTPGSLPIAKRKGQRKIKPRYRYTPADYIP